MTPPWMREAEPLYTYSTLKGSDGQPPRATYRPALLDDELRSSMSFDELRYVCLSMIDMSVDEVRVMR